MLTHVLQPHQLIMAFTFIPSLSIALPNLAPNILFSGSILWTNPAIYAYGDILDFTIAKIYNTKFLERPDWIISKIIDASQKIPMNTLVTALFTFYNKGKCITSNK